MPGLLRSVTSYDLGALRRDLATARSISPFDEGYLGGTISLPSASEVHPDFREQALNLPFIGCLERCPAFASVFHMFPSEKTTFRLLRTPPNTFYGPHTDRGVLSSPSVEEIARFQVPVLTSDRAFICLSDAREPRYERYVEYTYEGGLRAPRDRPIDHVQETDYGADRFRSDYPDARIEALEAGFLWAFDTSRVHMITNEAQEERVTLVIDVVVTPELRTWMQQALRAV